MSSILLKILVVFTILLVITFTLVYISTGKNKSSRLESNSLDACPASPNCVSTSSKQTDEEHYVEPLAYNGIDTLDQIVDKIVKLPRVTLKAKRPELGYAHLEFRTKIGFVDDVEIMLDSESNNIYFRSISRVGHSDFGVNRKRYNMIKSLLQK